MWFWHILVKKIWFQRGLELIKKNHLQRFGLRYCYGQNNKRNWVTLYPRNISMTCVSSRADCVKSVQIRNYFWSVFSSIRTEYGEIRTRNNSVFGHFSRSVLLNESFIQSLKQRIDSTEELHNFELCQYLISIDHSPSFVLAFCNDETCFFGINAAS